MKCIYIRTLSIQEFNISPLTSSEARANLYCSVDQAVKSHQALQETLHLLSVQGMRESIKEGMAEPVDVCAKALDW